MHGGRVLAEDAGRLFRATLVLTSQRGPIDLEVMHTACLRLSSLWRSLHWFLPSPGWLYQKGGSHHACRPKSHPTPLPSFPQSTKLHYPFPSVATAVPDRWNGKDLSLTTCAQFIPLSLQTLVECYTKGNDQISFFSSFLLALDLYNWALEAHTILSIQTSQKLSSHWDHRSQEPPTGLRATRAHLSGSDSHCPRPLHI